MRVFGSAVLAAAVLLGLASPAEAGPHAEKLGACIVAKTSPPDRLALARWIANAINAHPSVAATSPTSEADREKIAKETAVIFERLLLTDCRKETVDTITFEGMAALSASFESLGKVAMEELMTNPAVSRETERMSSHIDPKKFESLGEEMARAAASGRK